MEVAAGVGRSLMPDQVTPEAVRRDVAALLQESSYRENALRLQREIEHMPSPAEVVTILAALV